MNMFVRILSVTLKTEYLATLKVGGRICTNLNREDTSFHSQIVQRRGSGYLPSSESNLHSMKKKKGKKSSQHGLKL